MVKSELGLGARQGKEKGKAEEGDVQMRRTPRVGGGTVSEFVEGLGLGLGLDHRGHGNRNRTRV